MKRSFNVAGILFLLIIMSVSGQAQNFFDRANVHGNFQIDAQTYHTDDALGITDSVLQGKTLRLNGYGDIRYSIGKFNAGLRYEAYLPPLAGFDPQYQGHGIPYWFAEYAGDELQVTAGHFYEQFGSGMILRAYQQWDLGYDNNITGLRVKYSPVQGLYFKGLIGTQRYYWEPFEDDNRGIVRGFDAELVLNDVFKKMTERKTRIMLGGSFVSKYEKTGTKSIVVDTTRYEYQLPANVASAAGRITISHGGFNFYTEYVHKFNNPSAFNNFIYKDGRGIYSTVSYSQKGFAVYFAAKSIDNMSYKSRMNELGNVLDINFIPPLTRQYIYTLENVYPYATQLNGETAFQGQVIYTIPKGSRLGGKYGTRLELNFSRVHDIDKQHVDEGIPIDSTGTLGYKASLYSMGDLFYQGVNFTFDKKLSKKLKLILEYLYLIYNIEVVEGHVGDPNVVGHQYDVDLTWKVTPRQSLRFEWEHLITRQDRGDWAMLLIEYNIAPKWFFSIMDQYNYGNPDKSLQLHYYTGAIAYVQGPHRFSLSYGRQREGLLCVGGVCRQVPASNGFSFTLTTSF
jgi:hypothetical protein